SSGIDLAAEDQDTGITRELPTPLEEIGGICFLLGANLRNVRPWQLSAIVGAGSFDPSLCGRTVKEQDYTSHRVQIDEILAFDAHLLRAYRVRTARCERSSATRHIKPVVACDLELAGEESIGCFLQATVGARDDERIRTSRSPALRRRHRAQIDSEVWDSSLGAGP